MVLEKHSRGFKKSAVHNKVTMIDMNNHERRVSPDTDQKRPEEKVIKDSNQVKQSSTLNNGLDIKPKDQLSAISVVDAVKDLGNAGQT